MSFRFERNIQTIKDNVMILRAIRAGNEWEDVIIPTKDGETSFGFASVLTFENDKGRVKSCAYDDEGMLVPLRPSKGLRRKMAPKIYEVPIDREIIDDQEAVMEFDRLMELDRRYNLSGNSSESPSQRSL